MKKRRGLTLIEVIISLAIVGIIAVVFLNVFTSGIKNIFTTKRSTENIYEIERVMDEDIKNAESGGVIKSDSENKKIKVNINEVEIEVSGKLIKAGEEELQITTFVPYEKTSE